MKAKLYKGPKHGKTYDVQDGMNDILFREFPKFSVYDTPDNPCQLMVYKTGRYERTHHTHPDGSTFFVWKGWT